MFSCHSYFFLLFVYQDGQTATTEVHSISSLLRDSRESQELSAFPGPLKPGETHKNNVIKFCERKIFSVAGRKDIADLGDLGNAGAAAQTEGSGGGQ